MSEPVSPPPPDDAPKPADDQADDPNRDRDKPRHPAPPGAGESGTAHNPKGAEGVPPGLAQKP